LVKDLGSKIEEAIEKKIDSVIEEKIEEILENQKLDNMIYDIVEEEIKDWISSYFDEY